MTEWTFAMVDLAGYTALTETHGDEHAADLATTFTALARECLGPADRLIKPIGDAVLLAAPDPESGIGLVDRLLNASADLAGFPLARAGLHHGPAAEREGDVFGAAVNLAARVAGQAAGGQTLATFQVAEAARQQARLVHTVGPMTLRNVTVPVELFDIGLGPTRESGAVDPVCRMWVDHDHAAGRLRHHSREYWFCSLDCAATFAKSPEQYELDG
jgi:adenylate cyclase